MKPILIGVALALAVSVAPQQSIKEIGVDRTAIEVRHEKLESKPFKTASLKVALVDESKPKSSSGVAKKVGTKCSGGTLKDRIICCESGGDYTAQNPVSTASGRYQFLDTTWNNYKGYSKARLAPPGVQDEYFNLHFEQNGSTPWLASKHCWG